MNLWKVNIVVGRFQPLTLGHIACAKEAERRFDRPTVLCMINTPATKTDEKHPFPTDVFYPIYWDVCKRYKFIEDIVIVPSADIVKISQILAEKGLRIGSWTCGTDRYKDYKRMVDKYSEAANLPDDFELIEVKRTAEDISATKARQALIDGDRKTFNKITPFGDLSGYLKGQSSFDTFRKYMSFQVHENVNESFLLGGIAAAAFVSFAFIPIFNKTKGFLSKFFSSFFNDDDDDKKEKRSKKNKDNDTGSSRSTEDILDVLTKAADDANKKEKDPEVQAKNQEAIDLLAKSSTDEDGNPIPADERLKKIEDQLPEDVSPEEWQKSMQEQIKSNTDDETKSKLDEMLSKVSREDIESAKKENRRMALDAYIKDAEDAIESLSKKDDEIQEQIKELEGKDDEESKKKLDELKKESEEIQNQIKRTKKSSEHLQWLKKHETGEKPEGDDDSKTGDGDSKTGDGDSKTETKEIDGETFTLKDGKWVNKDGETMEEQEITDPDNPDKKIKVKAYTGPRGGKYYWPKGKAKTPENKVYIQESFVDYLYRMLG